MGGSGSRRGPASAAGVGDMNPNVSVDLGAARAAAMTSGRPEGAGGSGGGGGEPPPPSFPLGYAYVEYSASLDFDGVASNEPGGGSLTDSRGGGHRATLASQHVQQHQQHVSGDALPI